MKKRSHIFFLIFLIISLIALNYNFLDKKILVCSQLGYKGRIVYGKTEELKNLDLKLPICFIIPSKMHFLEEEALRRFEI